MPSLNKINTKKGIIFDFDDTIANTLNAKKKGLRIVSSKIHNFLGKKGVKTDLPEIYKEVAIVAEKMVEKGIDNRNVWWKFIIKKFSKEKPSESFLITLTKDYWYTILNRGTLYKNVPSLLNYFKKKGYRLGLLTDTDGLKGFKTERIAFLNSKKWFDSVVIAGEHTKKIKPDKGPFILILKNLNLKPQECIYVGNDPHRDILGAERMGMTTILIKRNHCQPKIKPDRIITSLNKLKTIIS